MYRCRGRGISWFSHFIYRNNCDCFVNNASCQCMNTSREHLLSTTAKFSVISAIICTPDGVLHIADQVIAKLYFATDWRVSVFLPITMLFVDVREVCIFFPYNTIYRCTISTESIKYRSRVPANSTSSTDMDSIFRRRICKRESYITVSCIPKIRASGNWLPCLTILAIKFSLFENIATW